MPTAPAKSLWDTYALMVEKSPTYTVILTGAVLVLVLLIFVFGVLASSAGLRTFLRKIIRGIKYSEGKLAYEGSSKSDDMEIQTDEKGNVKPPAEQKEPPTSQAASLIRIFGYLPCRMHGERWNTRSRKLKNAMVICKILQGIFPAAFVEAEYFLARIRCGDNSALDTLKGKSGPNPEAYAANGALATYYKLIGATDEALRYLEIRFQHAPDIGRKLLSARALATLLAEAARPNEGLQLLRNQLSYFQSAHDQALLWESIGRIFESKGMKLGETLEL